MEPQRGIAIQEITVEDMIVKQTEYVWMLGPAESGRVLSESNNKIVSVPEDCF